MRLQMSDKDKDIIEVCITRHNAKIGCRRCKYNGKECATFRYTLNQIYYKVKEIINYEEERNKEQH